MYIEGIEETIAAADGREGRASRGRWSISTDSTWSAIESENEQRTISFADEDVVIPSPRDARSRQRWYSRQDILRMRKRAGRLLKGQKEKGSKKGAKEHSKGFFQRDEMRRNVRTAVLREQRNLREKSESNPGALAAISAAVTAVSKARALVEGEKAAAFAQRIHADSAVALDDSDD